MLEGKVVVVTGAGRGIGREMALGMGRAGAAVVVNDVGAALDGEGTDETPADQTVADIAAAGGQAAVNTASVADPKGAETIIETAIDAFGRIDAVVNNAGILRDRIFHRMEQPDWEAVIGVHLMGSFYVSRAAAPHFRAQESGAYVHFTSTSGLVGNVGQANYSAAKMGIAGLSRSIALDMARFHVRSNCISPFAMSRMVGSIPADSANNESRIGRFEEMTPARIAPLATYLVSDQASEVTGQIFAVRSNEIFLMSQPRPVRGIHRGEGWTPETIAEHAMPALRSQFVPLEVSGDVFGWDPV